MDCVTKCNATQPIHCYGQSLCWREAHRQLLHWPRLPGPKMGFLGSRSHTHSIRQALLNYSRCHHGRLRLATSLPRCSKCQFRCFAGMTPLSLLGKYRNGQDCLHNRPVASERLRGSLHVAKFCVRNDLLSATMILLRASWASSSTTIILLILLLDAMRM